MKIKKYVDEESEVVVFAKLLEKVYAATPHVAQVKYKTFVRNMAKENPFRAYGQWVNIIVYDHDEVVAHATVVFDKRLEGVAHVGYVECVDSFEAFSLLMDEVRLVSKEFGANVVRGPINFNTWQDFRCLKESGNYPPIFLEPYNPNYLFDFFVRYGWKNVLTYESSRQPAVEFRKEILSKVKELGSEYTFTLLTENTASGLMPELRRVAMNAFEDTLSFIKLTEEEFAYMYDEPIKRNDVYNIFVAQYGGEVVGFAVGAFNIFDPSKKTYCVKTVAVHVDHQNKGVSNRLLVGLDDLLKDKVIEEYIFMTMKVDNTAIQSVLGHQSYFRTYNVFELSL